MPQEKIIHKAKLKSGEVSTKIEITDPWEEVLKTEKSQTFLAVMADKARKNHEAGKTKRGGFGKA